METYTVEDRDKCLKWLLSACRTWLCHARQTRSESGSGLAPSKSLDSGQVAPPGNQEPPPAQPKGETRIARPAIEKPLSEGSPDGDLPEEKPPGREFPGGESLNGEGIPSLTVPPDLNRDTLKQMAYFQGIAPILYDLIRQNILPKDNLPPNIVTDWERTYFSNVIQNTRFTELLSRIASHSSEQNIPVIALKGMASTAALYKDLGLRSMADIDLLCRTRDLIPLRDILHSLGFAPKGSLQAHHIAYHHPGLGILVECHFALQYIVNNKKELLSLFWEHRRPARIDEARFPILSTEDQLLFEMAHIADHVYHVSLKHYLDFAGWLTLGHADIDWDYLTSLLNKSGMIAGFASLTRVLSEILQIPIKIPLQEDIPPKKINGLKNTLFSSLRDTGFIKTPLTATRIKSYATLTQKVGFTLRKLFPSPPVIRATYNTSSSITSFFSYPYHIAKTLLDFRSRKKREQLS